MRCTTACLVALCLLPASLGLYKHLLKKLKPKDTCHTVWEEVVTPRCKTTYEELCTTVEEEKCKTSHTTQCEEHPQEHCETVFRDECSEVDDHRVQCNTEYDQECWEESEEQCEQVCHSKPVKRWKMSEDEEEEEEHDIVKRQAYGGGQVFYQPQPVAFQPAPATYHAPAPATYHAPATTFTSQGSSYGAPAPVYSTDRVYRSAEDEEGEEAEEEEHEEGGEEEHEIVKRQAYGGGAR